MRSVLALLAVLSLVARWADAPCGCAEHNGWVALVEGPADHAGHDHGSHDDPGVSHDCGGTGPASFAANVRVQPTGSAMSVPPVDAGILPGVTRDPDELSPAGTPPLRAALNVYRV